MFAGRAVVSHWNGLSYDSFRPVNELKCLGASGTVDGAGTASNPLTPTISKRYAASTYTSRLAAYFLSDGLVIPVPVPQIIWDGHTMATPFWRNASFYAM